MYSLFNLQSDKNREFIIFIIPVQIVFIVLVILRLTGLYIPVLSTALIILYLSFLPGILILHILKLGHSSISMTICYSVGISLIFNMMLGFLMNVIFHSLDIQHPLSTLPILITWAVVLGILTIIAFRKEQAINLFETFRIAELLNPRLLLLLLLPVLAVLGANSVTFLHNNIVLIILLALVAVTFIVIVATRIFPPRYHPLAIYCFSLALLWHFSFVSEYLVQWDSFLEYHYFGLANTAEFWDWTIPQNYNAMLSITILPTVVSQLSGITGTAIFKIIYPLWYALVPVVLYTIYRHRIEAKPAFCAAFFFISIQVFFLEMPSINRQMIAELFIVLLISLILYEVITGPKKVLLILFGIGIIISHYSLTYIYIGFLIISIIMVYLFRRRTSYISITFVVLFIVISIVWYLYVSSAQPLESLVVIGKHIATSMSTDLFNPTSRDLSSIFMQSSPDAFHLTYRVIWYFLLGCIALGGIPVLLDILRKKSSSPEYDALIVGSYVLLAACIVIPFFSVSLGINRMIHIASIVLAPLGIAGLTIILDGIKKLLHLINFNKYSLNMINMTGITTILVIFFLFNCRLVYELGNSPFDRSIPLAYGDVITNNENIPLKDRITTLAAAPTAGEVASATWLKENRDIEKNIYATPFQIGTPVLVSYGMVDPDGAFPLIPSMTSDDFTNSYVYLGYINSVLGYGTTKTYTGRPDPLLGNIYYWDIDEIKPVLNDLDTIYSNGKSDIYWAP